MKILRDRYALSFVMLPGHYGEETQSNGKVTPVFKLSATPESESIHNILLLSAVTGRATRWFVPFTWNNITFSKVLLYCPSLFNFEKLSFLRLFSSVLNCASAE